MMGLPNNSLPFAYLAEQAINKVCLFLAHEGNLVLVVRYHPKDNSVSIEPPGGKVDPKPNGDLETHGEALIREAVQEVGVRIKPLSLLHIEPHPHTKKPVAYYSSEHVAGTPFNMVRDEHLDILEIPLSRLQSYEEIKLMALEMAQTIVDRELEGQKLSRPIEFRVPEVPLMNFAHNFMYEQRSDFGNISAENSALDPKPA